MENEMLDPNWTPEAGYAHADGLLAILARHDEACKIAAEHDEVDE
jgi:hypothetical protein